MRVLSPAHFFSLCADVWICKCLQWKSSTGCWVNSLYLLFFREESSSWGFIFWLSWWFHVIFIPMFLIFYSVSPVLSTWSDKFCSTIAKAEPIGIHLDIFFPFSYILPIFEPLEGAVDSTFQICCECNQLSPFSLS